MKHDVNLNIHYSAPEGIWCKISEIFKAMPYWAGTGSGAYWIGENIDLWASVEPSGIQIAGTMPDEIWEVWYRELKEKLTAALGYEIGEPEDVFDFQYWE